MKEFKEESIKELSRMPDERRKTYIESGISELNANKIIQNKSISDYLERFLDINLVIASNLLLGDITSYLNKHNVLINDTKLTDDKFRELVTKLDKKEISNKIFKDILDDLMESDKSIQEILDEKGLVLVNDKDAVISLVKGVLAENIEMVKQYKEGNTRASKALMGQVMKVSKGSIDPSLANSVLMECLDNYE